MIKIIGDRINQVFEAVWIYREWIYRISYYCVYIYLQLHLQLHWSKWIEAQTERIPPHRRTRSSMNSYSSKKDSFPLVNKYDLMTICSTGPTLFQILSQNALNQYANAHTKPILNHTLDGSIFQSQRADSPASLPLADKNIAHHRTCGCASPFTHIRAHSQFLSGGHSKNTFIISVRPCSAVCGIRVNVCPLSVRNFPKLRYRFLFVVCV